MTANAPASAASAASAAPHPQLLAALDVLAERMPPNAHREDGEVRIPRDGVDRESFERAIRGVESAIAQSPQWPLLVEILAHLKPLADSIRGTQDEVVVPLKFGYRFHVLVWSAHEQEKHRRRAWNVPDDPRHDVLAALAKRSAADRATAIRMLCAATNPKYSYAARNLVDAIRVGRGAADPESFGFLAKHDSGTVQRAANGIAADIFMERRELPWTFKDLADAFADALHVERVDQDRDLSLLLRGMITNCVAENFPAERTRWPLLRGALFEVGHIDATWRVVIMRHRDVGGDAGASWRHPVAPADLPRPEWLFEGDGTRRKTEDRDGEWFQNARAALGLDPLDALVVCPVATDAGGGQAIWDAWTLPVRAGIDLQVRMNVAVHADALQLAQPRPDVAHAQLADRVEQFIRATTSWVEWHNLIESKSSMLAMLPPNEERPELVEGLVTLQREKNGFAAEIRKLGPALAHDLERSEVDAAFVLTVVHCADGGGGPVKIAPRWAEGKVALQQAAIRLRVRGGAKSPPVAAATEHAVAAPETDARSASVPIGEAAPPKLTHDELVVKAMAILKKNPLMTLPQIAQAVGIERRTIYKKSWRSFRDTREQVQGMTMAARRPPGGFKNSETGDIEAFDDPRARAASKRARPQDDDD